MLQKKYLFMALGVFILLCIVYFLTVALPRQGKVGVEVLVHPGNADVYIDNKKSSSGTVYLRPGLHTFRAEKSGWNKDETSVTISDELTSVALLPTPASDEAREEAEADITEREGLYGVAANARGLDIRTTYPALDSLPYSDVSGPFKIDYGFNKDDDSTPFLIVSYSTPNGRKKAVDWLLEKKIDVTMIDIIFEDFINPIHTDKHND